MIGNFRHTSRPDHGVLWIPGDPGVLWAIIRICIHRQTLGSTICLDESSVVGLLRHINRNPVSKTGVSFITVGLVTHLSISDHSLRRKSEQAGAVRTLREAVSDPGDAEVCSFFVASLRESEEQPAIDRDPIVQQMSRDKHQRSRSLMVR